MHEEQIKRYERMVADNAHLAERLEAGEIQVFSGPRIDENSNGSAALAANLRRINRDLQPLIDRLKSAAE